MDKLDEAELEGIWRRVKHYIPVSRITGRNRQEVLNQIGQYMRDNETAGRGAQGSMETLVNKGFATEGAFGRTREFESSLDKWLTTETERPEAPEVSETPTIAQIPKLKIFSNGRASVSTKRGKRVYARRNLNISFSEFKGKRSYYIYNTRTKKRITWGVVND